jgi:hypothetical protein
LHHSLERIRSAEIDRRADEGQDRNQREREGYGNVAATRRGNAACGTAKAKNKDMGRWGNRPAGVLIAGECGCCASG